MVIQTVFDGKQKKFHTYWLPLMYKHQECEFHVEGKFVYPKDVKNLKVGISSATGPTLKCPMNKIPTYKAMIELAKKPKEWIGTPEDLGVMFYDI